MSENGRKLYLFDFDGTLTHQDSLFDFLKNTQTNYGKGFFINIPKFAGAKLGLGSNSKAKESFVSYLLKGKTQEEITEISLRYFEKNHQSLLRDNALRFIQNLEQTDDKYLVSASLDIWLQPFADFLGLKRISTEAEFKNGKFTGKFATPNCNYEEKAKRIQNEIHLTQYDEVLAFGDTSGDKFMYQLADTYHHKFFHR